MADYNSIYTGAQIDDRLTAVDATVVSDGSGTDVEIQSAIDGLTSGRTWKEKVVIKGEFTLTTPITVPSYTILEIQGSLTGTSSNNPVIDNENATDTDIEIIGGFIDVDNTTTPWNKAGIRMDGVTRLTIRDVHIIDAGQHCISLTACDQFMVQNCILENAADDGISVLYSTFGRVIDNHIVGGTNNGAGGAGPSGIEMEDGSHDITVSGNTIEGIEYATTSAIHIVLDPGGAGGCYNLTVANNVLRGGEYDDITTGVGISVLNNKAADTISAISADGDGTVEITATGHLLTDTNTWKVIIEDITDSGLTGINGEHIATYIDANNFSIPVTATGTYTSGGTVNYDHNNITISGNTIENFDNAGINISTSRNLSISGNSINLVTKNSANAGINVGATKYSQIVGNALARAGNTGIGVASASDQVLIVGNTITDCAYIAANFYAVFLNTATNSTVMDNQCIDTRGTVAMYGIRSAAGGTNHIVNNEVSSTKIAGFFGEKCKWTAGDYVRGNGHHGRFAVTGAGAQVIDTNYNFIKLAGSGIDSAATIADAALQYPDGNVKVAATANPSTAHTVTLTSGTWDGTNNVATFNASGDEIVVFFDSEGNGTVLNNNSVVLS